MRKVSVPKTEKFASIMTIRNNILLTERERERQSRRRRSQSLCGFGQSMVDGLFNFQSTLSCDDNSKLCPRIS